MKLVSTRMLWLAVLFASAALADTYKWQDEQGLWHFSDRPPEDDSQYDRIVAPEAEGRMMISSRRAGPKRQPEHYFHNAYYGPAEIELSLVEATNVRSEPPLPARFVVAGNSEENLVALSAVDDTQAFSYRLSYSMVPGPPSDTLPPDPDFNPPFHRGQKFMISQGSDDSHTHRDPANRYAIDIVMPKGTPVLAARSGVVMDFNDNFEEDGKQDAAFLMRANYVRLLHEDGSMAVYAHLNPDSVRVRPGMRVPTGHWIADSGNSGFSSGPHLHFVIQQNVGMSLESLPIRFKLPTGGVMDPDRPQWLHGVFARPR